MTKAESWRLNGWFALTDQAYVCSTLCYCESLTIINASPSTSCLCYRRQLLLLWDCLLLYWLQRQLTPIRHGHGHFGLSKRLIFYTRLTVSYSYIVSWKHSRPTKNSSFDTTHHKILPNTIYLAKFLKTKIRSWKSADIACMSTGLPLTNTIEVKCFICLITQIFSFLVSWVSKLRKKKNSREPLRILLENLVTLCCVLIGWWTVSKVVCDVSVQIFKSKLTAISLVCFSIRRIYRMSVLFVAVGVQENDQVECSRGSERTCKIK